MIPPTVEEVKRVILATTKPAAERQFRLRWSLFRRIHQAAAKRCHKARNRAKHAEAKPEEDGSHCGHSSRPKETGEQAAVRAGEADLLVDAQWERVRALLPTQNPGEGRPRRDDRQVLRAILWIMYTGSSWRDLPEEEFGPNSTIHGRYRKWCKEGLWPRIVEALGR